MKKTRGSETFALWHLALPLMALNTVAAAAQGICSGTNSSSNGVYNVTYSVSGDSITFTLQAQTNGWVGIGFSLDQFMSNSDVIAGVSNPQVEFVYDGFASSRSRPPADVSQDIMNASAAHENGVITVGFSRERVTNDSKDMPLDQCVYFLYAWGGMFNIMAQQIDYHGSNNREASSTMICLPSSSDCPNADECALDTHNCQQNCINTDTSFTCGCFSGFTLDANGVNCTALQVQFAQQNYTVTEGDVVNIILSASSTSEYMFNVTVTLQDMNGSATAGSDYTAGPYTVIFSPGLMYATLMVPIMDDNTTELSEYFMVAINSTDPPSIVIGSPSIVFITIQEPAALQVQFDPQNYTVTAGGVASITLVTSTSSFEFDFNVTLQYVDGTATAGSDFTPGPYTVTFTAGQQSATLMVSTMVNDTAELSKYFTVMITSVDSLGIIEIGSPNTSFVGIVSLVRAQIDTLANIAAMDNRNLTLENITFLTGTVNEVLDNGPIDNMTARVLVAVLDDIVAAIIENQNNTGVMVLNALDRVAGATIVMDEMPMVQVEENVVVEVVVRSLAVLQQSRLTTTQLRGRNRVVLPQALFSLFDISDTTRFTAISINNRNLLPPRARNNRLRGNIISVNLNTTGPLHNLRNNQRIQLTFNRDTNTNDAANGAISCVFYDIQILDWSTEGCEMVMQDAETVTCACNHLTAFSILQSPAVPTTSTQPVITLAVTLSVVGGAVFLTLVITGVAYLIWRSRRKSHAGGKIGEL